MCKVLNYSPETLVLRKGAQIASISGINNINSCTPFKEKTLEQGQDDFSSTQSPEVLEKFFTDYGFKINPEISQSNAMNYFNCCTILRMFSLVR